MADTNTVDVAALLARLAELEAQVTKAKSAGAHNVEIREHKGANYVVTSGFTVPKVGNGGTAARGLFLRVEAIDQAIADLQAAKGLLTK